MCKLSANLFSSAYFLISASWFPLPTITKCALGISSLTNFAIFTNTSGAFWGLIRPTIPTTYASMPKLLRLTVPCSPLSYASMSTPLKMTCSLSSLQIFFSKADCFSASEMQMIFSQNGAAIFSMAVYIALFLSEHRILNAQPCGLYTQ